MARYAFLLLLGFAPQSARPPAPVPTVRVLVYVGRGPVTVESRGVVEVFRPDLPKPLGGYSKLPAQPVLLKEGKVQFGSPGFAEPSLILRGREPIRVGDRSYPGEIHLVAEGAALRVVNEVDLEQYVAGVVPAEIGSGAPIEAMKVQAVCARSFAVARMGGFREGRGRPVYDMVDDTRDQVYVGVPAVNTNLQRAVEATAGLYVTWKKNVLSTYFSSSCGGHTLGVSEWSGAGDIPPLSGVPCGYCEKDAPNGSWELRISLEDLGRKLEARLGKKPLRSATILSRTKSDRVETVLLEHAAGRAKLSGSEFVSAVGGRNTRFTLKLEKTTLLVQGRGFGHGVGLCQVGALNQAAAGRGFREILAHYFPQAELTVLYGPARR